MRRKKLKPGRDGQQVVLREGVKKDADVVTLDIADPERAFARIRDTIRAGGVIAYPTDTFYGLGADPGNPEAVRRLFAIKGRQADRPILVLIHDAEEVGNWAAEIPCAAEELMRRYWPGPLTIVFKAKTHVLAGLTAGTGTIGLRVPGSELTRKLLSYLGTPLTGTSANVSGGPSPQSAEEAARGVEGAVDLVVDGGTTAGGRPSTVVDVSSGKVVVVREGAVTLQDERLIQ